MTRHRRLLRRFVPRRSRMRRPAVDGRLRLPFSPWHLVLIPLTFILIVPLLWMLITSLETEGEANRFPPVLLPEARIRELLRGVGGGTLRALLRQQHVGHAGGARRAT